MTTKYCALVLPLLMVGCVKTPQVVHLKPGADGALEPWSGEGFIYALPRTAFETEFKVARVELEPATCGASYLELGGPEALADALRAVDLDPKLNASQARTVFSLTDARLTFRAVPDPNALFLSRIPTGRGGPNLKVTLGPEGNVSALDASASSQAMAVTAKVLEVAGTIAGKLISYGAAAPETQTPDERTLALQKEQERCDEQIARYGALKEELAAFRESPTPHHEGTVALYQKEIRAEMAASQGYFLGQPKVHLVTVRCQTLPTVAGAHEVLRFSVTEGFLSSSAPSNAVKGASNNAAKDATSCLIPENFKATDIKAPNISGFTQITLNLVTAESEGPIERGYQAQEQASKPSEADAGFFYRVPKEAWVSLDGAPGASAQPLRILVPQLGTLHALPRVKGTSPSLNVELHPETGALKSVSVLHKSADLTTLATGAEAGAASAVDALIENESAASGAAADSPSAYEEGLENSSLAIEIAKKAIAGN